MADPLEAAPEKLPENVHVVETSYATVPIIYEQHNKKHGPESMVKSDVMALEFVGRKNFSEVEAANQILKDFRTASSKIPGNQLFQTFEENSVPIVFLDIADETEVLISLSKLLFSVQEAAMFAIGGGLTAKLGASALRDRRAGLSRRSALKGVVATALGVKAVTPGALLASELPYISEKKQRQLGYVGKKMQALNELVNPETNMPLTTFRNAIWAHKLEVKARKMSQVMGKKPIVGLNVGSAHSGIESMLNMNHGKRLEYIRRMTAILSQIAPFGKGGIIISSVAEFSPQGVGAPWKLEYAGSDPELKAIEDSLQKK